MPKKEQIQKIVDRLLDGTKDGSVIWKLSSSIFNSETRHQYSNTTEDGKTTFNFEICLDDKFQPSTVLGLYVYMYNSDLIDGKLQISSSNYKGVDALQQLIYNKWIKPTLPIKNEAVVLDDIFNTIGDKQSKRDRILDEILDTDKKCVEEKENESDIKSKESFLSKIFKRL